MIHPLMKVLIPIVSLLVGLRTVSLHARTDMCDPPDSTSAALLEIVQGMMSPDDSLRIDLQLPLVSAAEVTVVQSDSTCLRATEALDDLTREHYPGAEGFGPRPVYVIAVGDYFGVYEHDPDAGHWGGFHFFSPIWAYLGTVAF